MTYGSPIWWKRQKNQSGTLEKVQNASLRFICGAFRTSPSRALEVIASIPPILHRLDLIQSNSALRLNKMDSGHAILQRLPSDWRNGEELTYPPPLPASKTPTSRSTRLVAFSQLSLPSHERIQPFLFPPWSLTAEDFGSQVTVLGHKPGEDKDEAAKAHLNYLPDILYDPAHLLLYSDGSQVMEDGRRLTGAAFVAFKSGLEVFSSTIGLGETAEVYDAEMEALASAAEAALRYVSVHSDIHHLHFFADNSAAVDSIFKPHFGKGQHYSARFRSAILQFLDLSSLHSVEIAWTPGHLAIPGNDRADELAKLATSLSPASSLSSLAHLQRHFKTVALERWHSDWNKTLGRGWFTPANRFPPSFAVSAHFKLLSRRTFALVTQAQLGHAHIGD